MPDNPDRGLYQKYIVQRTDGKAKHTDCEYFVLDLTHDRYAIDAIKTYSLMCREEYPSLAYDLNEKHREAIIAMSKGQFGD